ncbi:TPA: hypothetical protein ACKPJR_006358 [Pseudomonas aeruginosa]
MSNRNDDGQFFMLLVLLGMGAVAFVIWKFSTALGIDMKAGSTLLMGMVAGIALIGFGWWQETSYSGICSVRGMLPLALWIIWLSMGPAMQQWGAIGPMFAGMTDETRPVEWWANGYTRFGVSLLILGGGYWLVFRQERY